MEINKKQATAHQQAMLQLLRESRLRPDELGLRLGQVRSQAYWKKINPMLSVDRLPSGAMEEVEMVATIEPLASRFQKEGYLRVDQIIPKQQVGRLRECTENLRRAGWPLVFGFVYDEFWLVTRTSAMTKLLSSILGPAYKQIPKMWTHHVVPQGGAGWPPHVDGSGRANRATVWVALSDATLENGCMYLIPKDATPARIARNFLSLKTITQNSARTLLMNTRALPVSAGGVICWDHSVIHWGSKSSGVAEPRLAISLEFIAESEKPKNDEVPLLDAYAPPTFPQRLDFIGRALLAYEKFEPLLIRYAELAKELVKVK